MHLRLLVAAFILVTVACPAHGQDQAQAPASDAKNAVLLEAVAPTYPHSHFKNPDRTVLVGLTITTEGHPENVHIVRTGGDRFDRNALATVSQYKFKPAEKSGQPIAQEIQVEVSYKSPH